MKVIDPKFHIEHDANSVLIVKTSNGEVVPEDEPLMLFRARDRNALPMLRYYQDCCYKDGCTDFQMEGIANRIAAFEDFRSKNPKRMKQPGITKGL